MSDDDFGAPDDGIRRYSLLDAMAPGCWLKLPLDAMREVGPAVQTLGAVLSISSKKETFVRQEKISKKARLPISTVRKHLKSLAATGWIESKGRQLGRRTCTIAVSKTTHDVVAKANRPGSGLVYGVLPWWAACDVRKFRRMPWCARAVLSVLMARLMSLQAVAERNDGSAGFDANCLISGPLNGTEFLDRFRFSLQKLQEHTGLSRPAVIQAKRELHRRGIIWWQEGEGTDGGYVTDCVQPRLSFLVVTTPASAGKIWIDFTCDGDRLRQAA